MKKIIWTGTNKVEIVNEEIPVPAPGQAVIKIKYAGLCGSDLHVFSGKHPLAQPPMVLGHEAVGTLYAINSDRTDVKVGDIVCTHTVEPCHACEACSTGHENLCDNVKIMGTNLDGIFAQYVCVNADRVIKFNEDVDLKIAALVEPLTVGIHDVRQSGLKLGENVLIGGAGPIGLLIGMTAKFAGASHVVLSEIDPLRMQMAEELGFTVANAADPEAFDAVCNQATNGKGFDVAFEITSVQSSFTNLLLHLKKGGVIVQVGMPPKGTEFKVDLDKLIYSECQVRGVRHHTMNDMQMAAKIINSGVMNDVLQQLVSAVYPMDECLDAFTKAATDKKMLRVLMDFDV